MSSSKTSTKATSNNVSAEHSSDPKTYVLRELCAKDIFPMTAIIRKIGLKDIGKCFEPEEIKKIMSASSDKNTGDSEDSDENAIKSSKDEVAETVGISVVLKMADAILENLPTVEQDIYGFLAELSGMTANDISNIPMDVFFEMLMDVFSKKEFTGFMKAVSRLLT